MFTKERFISEVPKAEIFICNKSLIECLISLNLSNRNVRHSHVEYLKRNIINGTYYITNNGIGINRNGEVIDGQHRLYALRDCGYPQIQLLIVYGLPEESLSAIDLGIMRTMKDIFRLAFDRPEANNQMMAAVRFYLSINRNDKIKKSSRPSPYEMMDAYIYLYPAFEIIYKIKNLSKLPSSVLTAFAIRIINDLDDERPLEFLKGLLSGINLEANSPILRLRNFLESSKRQGGGGNVQRERFQRTASALTAYLENRTLSKLYASSDPTVLLNRNIKK